MDGVSFIYDLVTQNKLPAMYKMGLPYMEKFGVGKNWWIWLIENQMPIIYFKI